RSHVDKDATGSAVVDDSVVRHVQPVLLPVPVALGPVRDNRRVFSGGALLNDVPDHVGRASPGELQLIAGASAGFVGQAVIGDVAPRSAALEQMSNIPLVKIAPGDACALDCADVQLMT